jgi:hypothetical protein
VSNRGNNQSGGWPDALRQVSKELSEAALEANGSLISVLETVITVFACNAFGSTSGSFTVRWRVMGHPGSVFSASVSPQAAAGFHALLTVATSKTTRAIVTGMKELRNELVEVRCMFSEQAEQVTSLLRASDVLHTQLQLVLAAQLKGKFPARLIHCANPINTPF